MPVQTSQKHKTSIGNITGRNAYVITSWRHPKMLYRESGDSYIIWGGLLVTMVLVNTWGCRHYLRSLDAATNSAAPTVISAASSYVLSGVLGIVLFDESSSLRWWAGAMLIILGLALVAQPRNKNKEE